MTGRKITLKNVGSTIGIFTYQTLSTLIWQYQVEILPGQTKVIFCVDGTFSYDANRHNISVLENVEFPPTGNTVTTTTTSSIPNEGQTLIQVSTISSTNTNWEYSLLNYGTNTILGPINLGISSTNWIWADSKNSNNGYCLRFSNNSTDEERFYFIDKNGVIVYTYNDTTNNFVYGTLENGKTAYFTDYINLKFIFTDFTNVVEYDIPSNYDTFYVDSEYNDSNTVGSVIYQRIDNYATYMLFKPTGYSLLYNWDTSSYQVESLVYVNSDYFVMMAWTLTNDQYSFFNVYDSNGVLIKSENLLSNNPTSISGITVTPSITNTITFNGYISGGTTNSGSTGSGAVFLIDINTGTTVSCIVYGKGNGYEVGDTITFDGTIFGGTSGVDNVVITADTLGNFTYDSFDINFFGDGKMNVILWDNNNNTVPYLIYVYDGITNDLYTTNHDHDAGLTSYYDWWTYRWELDNFSYEGQPSQDIHIQFNDDDGSFDGNLYSVDDCDIISWYNSDPGFVVYEFAKNRNYDYYISLDYYYVGDSLILYSNRDDNYINYEVFTPSGHETIQVVQTNSLDGWIFNNRWAGQKYATSFFLLGTNEELLFIHNYDGTYIDDLYINGSSDYDGQYNSLIITNYDTDLNYYWNTTVDHIQSLNEFYGEWNSTNQYYTTLNHNEGNIVIFNTNTYIAKILTKDSISPLINLSVGNNYSGGIGKNLVAYCYNDGVTNLVTVKVYNLQGTLLKNISTNETSWNVFRVEGNRVYLQTDSGNNIIHYLITSKGYKSVTTSNFTSGYEYNN